MQYYFAHRVLMTAHKFEEGYMQENQRRNLAMDRTSDSTKEKFVNHNFITGIRGKEIQHTFGHRPIFDYNQIFPRSLVSQHQEPVYPSAEGV